MPGRGRRAYAGGEAHMSKHSDRWCAICKRHLIPWYGALVCPVCDLVELPDVEDEDRGER